MLTGCRLVDCSLGS